MMKGAMHMSHVVHVQVCSLYGSFCPNKVFQHVGEFPCYMLRMSLEVLVVLESLVSITSRNFN